MWWIVAALGADIVTFETRSAVVHGKETASVSFKTHIAGRFGYAVDCGPKQWKSPPTDLALGAVSTLELTGLPKGTFSCKGAIEVVSTESGQSGTLNFTTPIASLDALAWKATVEDVDSQSASVWASRPLTQASAVITLSLIHI